MATRMGLEEITWSEIKQARDRLHDAAYLWGRRTDGLREADTERRVPGLGRGPGRGHPRVQSSVPRGVGLRGAAQRASSGKRGSGLIGIF